jgi:hypothetical protein
MKRGRSSNLFSQSKRPLELAHIFKSVVFGKDGKGHLYDLRFSRRFVLVRVAYLSSSKAYTNNWGLFGTDNYLAFIENKNDAFEKLEDLTLSQALDSLGMKSILRWTLLFMDRASKTYKGKFFIFMYFVFKMKVYTLCIESTSYLGCPRPAKALNLPTFRRRRFYFRYPHILVTM